MALILPKLPYGLHDLEPYISEETLSLHYLKHHKTYVDKANNLIRGTPYDDMAVEDIIIKTAHQRGQEKPIFENAAQSWNHTFYWNCMSAHHEQTPSRAMIKVIERSFGSTDVFVDKFSAAAAGLFGSGWAWLVKTSQNRLEIMPMSNAETPIEDELMPIMTCDVWEHAYYVDYRNDRKQYIKNFWKLLNWDFIETNYQTHFVPEAPHAPRAEYYH